MIKTKTVFILGAGTSVEAGFPDGMNLRDKISNYLNFSFSGNSLERGDHQIWAAIEKYANKNGTQRKDLFLKSIELSNSIHHSPSIDTYLNAHNHDELVGTIGKIAIVKCILEQEKNSLFSEFEESTFGFLTKKFQDTWYSEFFKIIHANVPKNKITEIFDKISIINFNYDRSISVYLIRSLMEHYGIDLNKSKSLVRNLNIIHPYGSVGSIFTEDDDYVPFGKIQNDVLFRNFSKIVTFNDDYQNSLVKNLMEQKLSEAKNIVFLGFAYHDQNMNLLKIKTKSVKYVFGTCYNMSEENKEHVENRLIPETFKADGVFDNIININLKNSKSVEFISNNSFRLTS